MSSIFITDGYTRSKQIAAEAGLHPEAHIVYRPALSRARTELGLIVQSGSAERISRFESELIARHVDTISGEKMDVAKAGMLIPSLRVKVIDLILGYVGSDAEAADVKNSGAGSV